MKKPDSNRIELATRISRILEEHAKAGVGTDDTTDAIVSIVDEWIAEQGRIILAKSMANHLLSGKPKKRN